MVATRLLRPLALPEVAGRARGPLVGGVLGGRGAPGARARASRVRGVDVNPTRTGFLSVLERMGARVERRAGGVSAPETRWRPSGSGAGRPLRGTEILPGRGALAARRDSPAGGGGEPGQRRDTRVTGARELRVKESDRLRQLVLGLRAMGADIDELDDGFVLRGPTRLRGGGRSTPRTTTASPCPSPSPASSPTGETEVEGAEWADISYPGFFEALRAAAGGPGDA